MTYIIIHPNSNIADESAIAVVNKHLKSKLCSFDEIAKETDFCVIEKGEKGSIKIEDIKNLQKKLLFSPFEKVFQFGIIRQAHFMTSEAQNALLKTLEECAEKTILILTVTNETSVLETILSRCNRIYPKLNESETGLLDNEFSQELSFLEKPIYEKINEVEKIAKENKAKEFLENLTLYFRSQYLDKTRKHKDASKEEGILKIINQAKERIKRNTNTKIALEYICFKIDKDFHN